MTLTQGYSNTISLCGQVMDFPIVSRSSVNKSNSITLVVSLDASVDLVLYALHILNVVFLSIFFLCVLSFPSRYHFTFLCLLLPINNIASVLCVATSSCKSIILINSSSNFAKINRQHLQLILSSFPFGK